MDSYTAAALAIIGLLLTACGLVGKLLRVLHFGFLNLNLKIDRHEQEQRILIARSIRHGKLHVAHVETMREHAALHEKHFKTHHSHELQLVDLHNFVFNSRRTDPEPA